jgi:hypothetical protein
VTASSQTLREAFQSLTEDIGELDALLFTTFGLSVEFFEDSVLAPLAVDQAKLSSAQDVFATSEFCDDANVGVFYDANATTALEKRVTFDTYPVFPQRGAFHPKIIVASGMTGGERVVRLLVGSANLTLAGWAHNREAFATVDVQDKATAGPLLTLLNHLLGPEEQRYDHLEQHLRSLADQATAPDSPRLHVTIPGRTNSLMQELSGRGLEKLTVYAPYFADQPMEYLRQACPEGDLTLVPSQDEDGRLGLSEAVVGNIVEAEQSTVQLRRLKAAAQQEEHRFDHFKAFGLPQGVIVGSHNATRAALGQADGGGHQNIEVSLELPGRPAPETVAFEETPRGTPEDELSQSEDTVEQRMPASISVTADWKSDSYLIELGRPMPDCAIKLPGIAHEYRLDDENLSVAFSDASQVKLLERKWFEVYRTAPDRQRIYRGLINETHWRTYRREAVLDSLTACFDAWADGTLDDPTAQQEHLLSASERVMADADARARPARVDTAEDDVFANYFRFFRASQRYWQRLKRSLDGDDATSCVRLMVSAPGSLERVVELTEDRLEEEGGDSWSVYRFVLVHELERLVRLVRQHTDADEVLEVAQKLEGRIGTLVERFEEHSTWQEVRKREDLSQTAQFLMERMEYEGD